MEDRDRKRSAARRHPSNNDDADEAKLPDEHVGSAANEDQQTTEAATSRAAKRSSRAEVVPKPARCLNAYNYFFQAERRKMLDALPPLAPGQKSHGVGFASMARTVSQRWKALPDNERAHYEALAAKDKQRYIREMNAWYAYNNRDEDEEEEEESQEADEPARAATRNLDAQPQAPQFQPQLHQSSAGQPQPASTSSGPLPQAHIGAVLPAHLSLPVQPSSFPAQATLLQVRQPSLPFQGSHPVEPSLPVQQQTSLPAQQQTASDPDSDVTIDDDIMMEFLSNPLMEAAEGESQPQQLQSQQQEQSALPLPPTIHPLPPPRPLGLTPSITVQAPMPQLFGSPAPGFLGASIQPLTPQGGGRVVPRQGPEAHPQEESKVPDSGPLSLPPVSQQQQQQHPPTLQQPQPAAPADAKEDRDAGDVVAFGMPSDPQAVTDRIPSGKPAGSGKTNENKEGYQELASRLGPDAVKFFVETFRMNEKQHGAAG